MHPVEGIIQNIAADQQTVHVCDVSLCVWRKACEDLLQAKNPFEDLHNSDVSNFFPPAESRGNVLLRQPLTLEEWQRKIVCKSACAWGLNCI